MSGREAPSGAQTTTRRVRQGVLRLLANRFGDGSEPLPDLRRARRVLLVCVNQRLGNTLVATAGLAAIALALQGAQLSFVGGAPAARLLRGFPLARVRTVRRSDSLLPWRVWHLVRELRSEEYDAAIHLSTATGSFGALLVGASGAAHTIGVRRGGGNVFFGSTVEPPAARHKVEELLAYVRQLGLEADGERTLALSAEERAEGAARLRSLVGEPANGAVGLFVGARGRKGKAWPLESFASVSAGLGARGVGVLAFLGPEELPREREIRAALAGACFVAEPDVRRVGALLSACRAVVTPDAGPMHLAIAAGAPTVAVFVRDNFDRWGPRPPHGVSIHDPDGTRAALVLDAVLDAVAGVPFSEVRRT
jgi:ADP-heptose:LPS heptosyltransferase